jgi:hypothetical protein
MARLPTALAIALSLLGASLVGSFSFHARADATAPPALQVAAAPTPTPPLASPPLPPTPPPPAAAPAPPAKPHRVIWYGWEPLVGAAGMMAISFAFLHNQPLTALTVGSLLSPVTTITMHNLHGEHVKGYVSLGLSYGMIAGGGVLGAKLGCGEPAREKCAVYGALTGMILGSLNAVIFDATVLAWGAPAPDSTAPKKAQLWPAVMPLPSGAALGLGGTF